MADARRRTIKAVYEDPRTGFGSIAQTLQQAQVRDPSISRGEVKAFLDGLRVNQDRPRQVDLADMRAFGGKPYPFMLVAIDALTNRGAAEGPSREHHRGGHEEGLQALGVPANVYSDAEFKREFKELMDFWDIEKQATKGHAYFAERTIRTIKEAVAPHSSRSGPAGAVAPHAGRHLEPNQRKEARYHAGGAEPRLL